MRIPNISSLHLGIDQKSHLSLPYIHVSRSLAKLTIHKHLSIHVDPEDKIRLQTLDVTSAYVYNLDVFQQFERIDNLIGVLSNNEIPHGKHTIPNLLHTINLRQQKNAIGDDANPTNRRAWTKSHPDFVAGMAAYRQQENINYGAETK